jgi:hypothetical protein
VQANSQGTCKPCKVIIRGQDRNILPERDRAQQEVRVRAVDSSAAAPIEAAGRILVVGLTYGNIRESSQPVPQLSELFHRAYSRQ